MFVCQHYRRKPNLPTDTDAIAVGGNDYNMNAHWEFPWAFCIQPYIVTKQKIVISPGIQK